MKLIYDREKAISRKEEVDREVEEENKWREKENKKAKWKGMGIASFLIALVTGVAFFLVFEEPTVDCTPLIVGGSFVIICIIAAIAFLLVDTDSWDTKYAQYPADVNYFLKTDGYNVLQVFARKSDSGYHGIYVDREDKDHKVETVCIGFIKDTVRADIPVGSEPIADLVAGEYCVPYERKEENR